MVYKVKHKPIDMYKPWFIFHSVLAFTTLDNNSAGSHRAP
jgi:hypothetical protein